VHDTPAVQRPQFGAADRVLDVEQRLAGARAQQRAVGAGDLAHAEEGELLLVVVEEGAFQDQLLPLRVEPQPVQRAPVQVLAAVSGVPVPGTVAAGLRDERDVGARVGGLADLHSHSMPRVKVSGLPVV